MNTELFVQTKPNLPFRKARARTPPPSINILMSRSSARISYTDISPDVKPTPTTSIAGDCTRAVMACAVEGVLEASLVNGKEYRCMLQSGG